MKLRTVLLSVLILIAGLPAYAKINPPRYLHLDRDVSVSGVKVPEGIYTLALETQGTSVRASFWKDGRYIASAHGSWVTHGIKYSQDAVLLRVNPDGTRTLTEIRLAGNTKSIVLDRENPVLRVSPSQDAGPHGSANSVKD